ncbi:hypothetical protein ACLVWQ_10040 (plasmid) [Streptomyces sp. CWNU-52B]|uniref:hypothetical protein n=1 Tax=unclassified Streptomyces TaxID=2593676 RepID=UPI0039C10061
MREQERQQGDGRAAARLVRPVVARGASAVESFAGVEAGAAPAPREVMALQRLVGNSGTARLLAQRGHRQGVAGRVARGAEVPVQRSPATEVGVGAQVPVAGRRAGAGVPAAARVVQRMPWPPDPAAAHRRILQQGWRVDEDGGYTRGPVPETGESAGGRRPEPAGREQQDQGQAAGEDEAVTLRVMVRKNASFRDEDYLNRVGHSWVAFYKGDKFQSSAGFYPKNGQINADAPHRSVPGQVRKDYDDPAEATTELSVDLDPKQFAKAQKYVQKNLNHEYNVFLYNCSDFVIGVHKAATGHSPPGRNLLFPNNPNDLHAGIKKHNNNSSGSGGGK